MKARKFQEKGIVFQSMGQVKRYEARWPVFFLHNFGVQFIGGILKKFFEGKLKACMKPVTRGCNLWPWKERLKERMSFKFWFSQKLNIKLFLTLEPLFLLSFFQVLPLKHSLPAAAICTVTLWNEVYDYYQYRHKWGEFGPLYLLKKHGDISF